MQLHLLPKLQLSAASNMALDKILLEICPENCIFFRHYSWSEDTFSFGRTQKYQSVQKHLPVHSSWESVSSTYALKLQRRITGGGLVDHRKDWTYSIILPIAHPLAQSPANQLYQKIHQSLSLALAKQNLNSKLHQSSPEQIGKKTDKCFTQPSHRDLIAPAGRKIAGAAQCRNAEGLIFQGSLNPEPWESFSSTKLQDDFSSTLKTTLKATLKAIPMPCFKPASFEIYRQKFDSEAWLKRH